MFRVRVGDLVVKGGKKSLILTFKKQGCLSSIVETSKAAPFDCFAGGAAFGEKKRQNGMLNSQESCWRQFCNLRRCGGYSISQGADSPSSAPI